MLASAARLYRQRGPARWAGPTTGSSTAIPGNILVLDAASGTYVPTWAIPAGQSGGPDAGQLSGRDGQLENQRLATDILPEQNRDAVYLAFGQRLASRLEFSGDLRASRRKFAFALPGSVNILTVTRANPYFVSPNGAASQRHRLQLHRRAGPAALARRRPTASALRSGGGRSGPDLAREISTAPTRGRDTARQ
jgi:iron complex outermembrane receptor protein